jgi:molecular chaperone HscB
VPFSVVTIADHFSLFGMPARFAIDEAMLESAYRSVQAQVHPDRFAGGTAAEKRVAMQWAARANEAYKTLRAPLQRAAYLCELHGVPIGAESNTAMPASFLGQQMQWREALDDARAAGALRDVEALAQAVETAHASLLDHLADALDKRRDYAAAAALVRQLMFVEKFLLELRNADAALRGDEARA